MIARAGGGRKGGDCGSTLIEFALVGLLSILLLLSFVEFGRMLLVYNSVANAARAGVRYAIVHGSHRATGTGVDGQSGPGNTAQVETVVRNFAGTGALDESRLSATCTPGGDGRICVTYPEGLNSIGRRVQVTVVYRYDPLIGILPLRVNLGSRSEGVIAY